METPYISRKQTKRSTLVFKTSTYSLSFINIEFYKNKTKEDRSLIPSPFKNLIKSFSTIKTINIDINNRYHKTKKISCVTKKIKEINNLIFYTRIDKAPPR